MSVHLEMDTAVATGTGDPAEVVVVVCNCGNRAFHIFFCSHEDEPKKHQHLQCIACNEGACSKVPAGDLPMKVVQ